MPQAITVPGLRERKALGQRAVMLTAYDYPSGRMAEDAGADILLVGDSLGMVIQGHDSTLPVTMDETEYHVRLVARGSRNALVVADLPFGSFQESPQQDGAVFPEQCQIQRFPESIPHGSLVQHLGKELTTPLALGSAEDDSRGAVLFNLAVVEKYDAIRHLARKAHLMGHDEHRCAFFR